MSLRYYACQLAQQGDDGAYAPSLPAGVAWVTIVPSGTGGGPRESWALVLVDTDDHAAVEGTDGVVSFELSPDDPMSTVPNNRRNQYQARLRQYVPGVTIDWNVDTARDVADRMAAWLEPSHRRGSLALRGRS